MQDNIRTFYARQGKTISDQTRQDNLRQYKIMQDKARQGKTIQANTTQNTIRQHKAIHYSTR